MKLFANKTTQTRAVIVVKVKARQKILMERAKHKGVLNIHKNRCIPLIYLFITMQAQNVNNSRITKYFTCSYSC